MENKSPSDVPLKQGVSTTTLVTINSIPFLMGLVDVDYVHSDFLYSDFKAKDRE